MSKDIEQFIEKRRQEASIDGHSRPAELEEKINAACRSALSGKDGEVVMAYLKSITLNTVGTPSMGTEGLWMLEGMRRIVGILDARMRTQPKQGGGQ